MDLFTNPPLPLPTSQTQEVLHELITRKTVSRAQFFKFCGILNVTARIADLRKLGLEIRCEEIPVPNKFKRVVKYGNWSLANIETATELYLRMKKDEKHQPAA